MNTKTIADFLAPVGRMTEAPAPGTSGLNPPVNKGDVILKFCHIHGGGGWWCGPYVVKYFSGDKPIYRPKFAKVDKIASTWALAPEARP